MKQKILEALKAKFPGVNANVLNRIADKLAKTVTTDEQITTAIAGVTKEFIEIIESYGDSRATEAQQTAVQTYETKYGLKDGQKIDNGGGSQGGQQGGSDTIRRGRASSGLGTGSYRKQQDDNRAFEQNGWRPYNCNPQATTFHNH